MALVLLRVDASRPARLCGRLTRLFQCKNARRLRSGVHKHTDTPTRRHTDTHEDAHPHTHTQPRAQEFAKRGFAQTHASTQACHPVGQLPISFSFAVPLISVVFCPNCCTVACRCVRAKQCPCRTQNTVGQPTIRPHPPRRRKPHGATHTHELKLYVATTYLLNEGHRHRCARLGTRFEVRDRVHCGNRVGCFSCHLYGGVREKKKKQTTVICLGDEYANLTIIGTT